MLWLESPENFCKVLTLEKTQEIGFEIVIDFEIIWGRFLDDRILVDPHSILVDRWYVQGWLKIGD